MRPTVGRGFTSSHEEEWGGAKRFHNGVDGRGESQGCERKHEREMVSVKNEKIENSIALLTDR